jgi:hypothetical protein
VITNGKGPASEVFMLLVGDALVWQVSDIEAESIRKQLASVTTQNPPAASIPTD